MAYNAQLIKWVRLALFFAFSIPLDIHYLYEKSIGTVSIDSSIQPAKADPVKIRSFSHLPTRRS
jgi:hypothetical protein